MFRQFLESKEYLSTDDSCCWEEFLIYCDMTNMVWFDIIDCDTQFCSLNCRFYDYLERSRIVDQSIDLVANKISLDNLKRYIHDAEYDSIDIAIKKKTSIGKPVYKIVMSADTHWIETKLWLMPKQ